MILNLLAPLRAPLCFRSAKMPSCVIYCDFHFASIASEMENDHKSLFFSPVKHAFGFAILCDDMRTESAPARIIGTEKSLSDFAIFAHSVCAFPAFAAFGRRRGAVSAEGKHTNSMYSLCRLDSGIRTDIIFNSMRKVDRSHSEGRKKLNETGKPHIQQISSSSTMSFFGTKKLKVRSTKWKQPHFGRNRIIVELKQCVGRYCLSL